MMILRSLHTRHGELKMLFAADAVPEQSKTEVFEKTEESLRPLCMVEEDLDDDDLMELCILSNELNETTATRVQ